MLSAGLLQKFIINRGFIMSRLCSTQGQLAPLILLFITGNLLVYADEIKAESSGFKSYGFVEAGIGYGALSSGYQDWFDQYLRGSWQITEKDRVFGEVSHQRHFSEEGMFTSFGYGRVFNENWYGIATAGTSTGGIFLPESRFDVSIFKKWLEKKNLITGISYMHYRARDYHWSQAITPSVIYYFDQPFILEVGARLTTSYPGAVDTQRGYVALTYGRNKDRYITLRYDGGGEGYQLVGSDGDNVLSNFNSSEVGIVWREWVTEKVGFNIIANYYENKYYDRSDISVGVFTDF